MIGDDDFLCEDCGAICESESMALRHCDEWGHSLARARLPGVERLPVEDILTAVEWEYQHGDLAREKYLAEVAELSVIHRTARARVRRVWPAPGSAS